MIYTIPSCVPFCDSLAQDWIKNVQDNIWGLSHITVFTPTNRASKTFKEAFLRQSNGKSLLLPKIVSFSDMDFLATNILPAISPLERQILLSKLIQKKQSMGEDKAFRLSASLAELIDLMHHYDVDFQKLKDIAPETFSLHWQQTISFLEIIQNYWPKILKERQQIDPALRQIKVVENLIHQWRISPPQSPVFAIGFTGGLPIIERFLKSINDLPNSNIYIPNLDKALSNEDWESLDETHPQFYIKKLLNVLNVKRTEVKTYTDFNDKFLLLSTALKPANRTSTWLSDGKELNKKKSCIKNVKLLECKTPQTEAFEIACILREVLEEPTKTAALVTTDRTLARRVRVQMARWEIELDDSAGIVLSKTPIGSYLNLLAKAGLTGLSKDLLALLKHPLALDGKEFNFFRKEIHKEEKRTRQEKTKFRPVLKTDFSEFFNLFKNRISVPFEEILRKHLDVAQQLAKSADKTGAERMWANEEGEVASNLFTELLTYSEDIGFIEPENYPAFLNAILDSVTVRSRYGMHPRLDILGPIEARLQQPDLVIIAGMNEGTFPQAPEADTWLNIAMKKTCGLPVPEEKIGVSAQDFLHLMQAKEVVLTRSLKVDGSPTIQSRWLSRLKALLECAKIDWDIENEKYTFLLEKNQSYQQTQRPAPSPELNARPYAFSISDISTFISDPYSIYAKKILNLYKLEELEKDITNSDFGTAVHDALFLYFDEGKEKIKNSTHTENVSFLLDIGKRTFAEQKINIQENPFLWEKFKRIADWFVTQEETSQPILKVDKHLEKNALLELNIGNTLFSIKGRSDRIDISKDNTATIIDYKTGYTPTKSQVSAGFAPQLPLEAIMLKEGAFSDISAKNTDINHLAYWKLKGKNVAGEIIDVSPDNKKMTMNDLLDKTKSNLYSLLSYYLKEDAIYPAKFQTEEEQKYNDYAHLERRAEWQVSEDEE